MQRPTDPTLNKILRDHSSLLGCLLLVVVLMLLITNFLKIFSLKPDFLIPFIFNTGELKEDNDRTNFLILGTGGARHEGPNLTDTIMFVSYSKKTGQTALLSLPRDIWVEKLKQKLNSVYAIGQADDGNGLELVKEIVGDITGLPVHYGVVIDFAVFKEIIDIVGGVDVVVDKTFDDFKYPKENGEYEAATASGEIYKHLRFEKGLTNMDGETALQFSRSRNSEDPKEGSDFARAKRQQKVFIALKNKLLSKKIITDIPKLQSAYKTIIQSIDTDIRQKNLPALSRLALSFEEKKVRTVVLDEGTKVKPGFLENPPVEKYGAWVLAPRGGSWQKFQEYLKKKLK